MTVQGVEAPTSGSLLVVALLVVTSAIVAALVALAFRLYLRDRVPTGLAALVSLAVVALYLNVKSALGQVAAGYTDPLSVEAVLFNGGTLVVAALVVPIGVRLGGRPVGSSPSSFRPTSRPWRTTDRSRRRSRMRSLASTSSSRAV
jgi:hypothetical protein